MERTSKNSVGKFIRKHRELAGFTQVEVACKLGYSSPMFVSNWERNLSYPPAKSVHSLAKMINVNSDPLIEMLISARLKDHRDGMIREFNQMMGRRV